MRWLILFLLLSSNVGAQIITTFAGNGNIGYTGDGGLATNAAIGFPGFIEVSHSGNLYIEELNNTIREISISGVITTAAGNGITGFSGDNSLAVDAQFNFTGGGDIAFDNEDNLFIADQANNRIRKINKLTGIVTTAVGIGVAGYSGDNGPALVAEINSPSSLAFDANGNLFFIDAFNYRIRKVNLAGVITTIAGNGVMGYSGDNGPAITASINVAGGIYWKNNYLYQADGIRIRRIDLTTGIITSVAGNGVPGFSGDLGPATSAQLFSTMDVAIDNGGNIYISDRNDNRIRIVNSSGIINTLVGDGLGGYSGDDGSSTAAQIYSPRGVALDTCGNLYISDNGNHRIRKVTLNHTCTPLDINTEVLKNEISIHPNPAQNELTIAAQKITSITITNFLGKEVFANNYNNVTSAETDISYLPPGVYVVKVNGCYVQKLIKE